jgi:hypothetical protein
MFQLGTEFHFNQHGVPVGFESQFLIFFFAYILIFIFILFGFVGSAFYEQIRWT